MDPLRTMVTDGTLENAQNLAQQYNRVRHEAETLVKFVCFTSYIYWLNWLPWLPLTPNLKQAAEVSKRQSRVRGTSILENTAKVQSSEAKMYELKANMTLLGKEAATALVAVESQQQRQTTQRLASLVWTCGSLSLGYQLGNILYPFFSSSSYHEFCWRWRQKNCSI